MLQSHRSVLPEVENKQQNLHLDCTQRINPQKHRIFFFLRDGRMTRLWAIVLQKTECLFIWGRAGARVQQGRAPERNFEESYKEEAGASSGPTLNLSASAGRNWGQEAQWPIKGLMAAQEQIGNRGRETQPAVTPVPSSMCFCWGVGRISRSLSWQLWDSLSLWISKYLGTIGGRVHNRKEHPPGCLNLRWGYTSGYRLDAPTLRRPPE